VTEPIEFTFMFLAPVLYVIHAILTGVGMVVMSLIGSHLGFTFSAGLFDYVINFGQSKRPWLLLPVGLVYAGVYYGLFRLFIARFDLKTPGREDEDGAAAGYVVASGGRGEGFAIALGGAGNLKSVSACTTRLRLVIDSRAKVDEPALKRLGARGVIAPSPTDLQVVLGPIADAVAEEINAWLAVGRPAAAAMDGSAVLDALGGAGNLKSVDLAAGRVRVSLTDIAMLDETALERTGVRGVATVGEGVVHLLAGPAAARLALDLQAFSPACLAPVRTVQSLPGLRTAEIGPTVGKAAECNPGRSRALGQQRESPMSKIWILAAAAATLAGCAADGENGGGRSALATGQCFRGDDVNNFNVKDEQTVYVSTR
jgi:PTS system N-acetylglucosamine-specific IIC component